VKLVDLNLLVYAVNRDAAQHQPATEWLEAALSGAETVALPWIVILGFLRLTTHARILARPLSAAQAIGIVDDGWRGAT
jgi:predicted nucleic acid-binding protein